MSKSSLFILLGGLFAGAIRAEVQREMHDYHCVRLESTEMYCQTTATEIYFYNLSLFFASGAACAFLFAAGRTFVRSPKKAT